MTEKKTDNSQPELFDLPKARVEVDDYINEKGKKKDRIPTGMTRKEINKLGKNKSKCRSGDASWPNDY